MPSATDFDLAAAAFGRASEDLAILVGAARPYLGPDTVDGGALAELVQVTLDVSDQNLTGAATMLTGLATVCRDRAAVCRAYAHDLQVFDGALDRWLSVTTALPEGEPIPPRPHLPSRPPTWVNH